MSAEEEEDFTEQSASFQSLTAEGDLLFQKSSLLKASLIYSRALDLKPFDKNILVKRSKCYILMG
jgi:tetratricopeptide repeat protein 25